MNKPDNGNNYLFFTKKEAEAFQKIQSILTGLSIEEIEHVIDFVMYDMKKSSIYQPLSSTQI